MVINRAIKAFEFNKWLTVKHKTLFFASYASSTKKSEPKSKPKPSNSKQKNAKGEDNAPSPKFEESVKSFKSKIPKRDPEQLRLDMERAKEYSRLCLHEHRQQAAGESIRLKLKKEAIAALPEKLRLAAMEFDYTPFPPNRIPAALSRPIPGYVDEASRSAEIAASLQKSR